MFRSRFRFRSDEQGAIAVVAAGAMAAMFGFAALAVDYGKLTVDRRRAQSVADLAALSAAADLHRAEQAARATVEGNGLVLDGPLRVEIGRYLADAASPPELRFRSALAHEANAARITLETRSDLYFARAFSGQRDMVIRTTATAATSVFGSFAIGSRLMSFEGGLVNALLGSLLDTRLNLSVMDYQALADMRIDLFRFLPIMADRARITAASYDQLLTSDVQLVDVIAAMAGATLTPEGGSTGASRALGAILQSMGGAQQRLRLSSLVSVGPYGGMPTSEAPAASLSAAALDMLMASAAIATGGRQVEAQLGINLPGIASATARLAIGERPVGKSWIAVGAVGTTVHTAQTRLLLTVVLPGAGSIAAITLPIYLELAAATARLAAVSCPFPDTRTASMRVAVTPAVADAWIGLVPPFQMTNFNGSPQPARARLVDTPLLRIHGRAHAAVTNMAPQAVSFSMREIEQQARKTVGTSDFTRSLLTRLVTDLELDVELIGIGLGLPGPIKSTVMQIVSSATPSLDRLVSNVLQTLGVGLGEADIWGLGLRCDGAVLVQ